MLNTYVAQVLHIETYSGLEHIRYSVDTCFETYCKVYNAFQTYQWLRSSYNAKMMGFPMKDREVKVRQHKAACKG